MAQTHSSLKNFKSCAFFSLLTFSLFLTIPLTSYSQEASTNDHARTAGLIESIPVNPAVKIGILDNGLRYYIRQNSKPESRAELRLVVNTGSIMEDDDQLGLAHFIEHMAFNGTTHFAKSEMVDFLESIGMQFGPEINASTSFDETVYHLKIPTDDAEIIEKAFLILEDWASAISFVPEEIDKERGVIIEEWRLGQGAQERIRKKQFPKLLKDSRYIDRLPIGTKESLETFEHKSLTRFYNEWYRPNLMAVIAVGDFEPAEIEAKIIAHFTKLENPKNARERAEFPVPDHKETLYSIESDKEITLSSVSVFYMQPVDVKPTVGGYRQTIIGMLYNVMLNSRLRELTQQASPPFLGASSGQNALIRTKEAYMLSAYVNDGGIPKGLETILTEAERVSRFGFTSSELERQKAEILRYYERANAEKDKTSSSQLVDELLNNFLKGESIPGIEYEYELVKRFLPEITQDNINQLAWDWITDENRVVLVSTPQKEGLSLPNEKELSEVFQSVFNKEIEAYKETVADNPLVETPPSAGEITNEKVYTEHGTTEWTLSNGVKVVFKSTDFKDDQILFTAFSPGGYSLVSDEDILPAETATTIITSGGLGSYNQIDLGKKLTGKIATATPFISELEEGLSGSTSPKDIKTLFELIYLRFTAPRKDEVIYQSLLSRIQTVLTNRAASPEAAFSDTLMSILTQNHPRAMNLTLETMDLLDLDRSFDIYSDRFADASDFTFVFTGNIDLEIFKPLVLQYIGGLPSIYRTETWKDTGIDPPKGKISKTVYKGIEPKSQTILIFTGDKEYTREESFLLNSMGKILDIRLREMIREERGGTYGVQVSTSLSWRPDEEYMIQISFGCDPERVEELVQVVYDDIEELKLYGPSGENIQKILEAYRRDRETDMKTNRFWLNLLAGYYRHVGNANDILNYDQLYEHITEENIQAMAITVLNTYNSILVSLKPEIK